MIDCKKFHESLKNHDVNFFTGVPDSLLKDLCAYINDHEIENHIIAANEGNALSIAAGYYLATNKVPMVYLQNSGLGNMVNPLTSLFSKDVYQIPALLLIGHRGAPGVEDEPQHLTQGKITYAMLDILNIPYEKIDNETKNYEDLLKKLLTKAKEEQKVVALVVSKATFLTYKSSSVTNEKYLSREDAVIEITENTKEMQPVILSTTGMLSRELYEYRKNTKSDIVDFYNVGSMGHVSQIALGVSIEQPEKNVFCFDGDGAALMHLGGLAIIADRAPENYYYFLFNNGAHDSVGAQETVGHRVNFDLISKGLGFKGYKCLVTIADVKREMSKLSKLKGPYFIEVKIKTGSRKDLIRPRETPFENKIQFMQRFKKGI